jgi:hypothetical protein
MIFLTHFFIKLSDSQKFFEKLLALFFSKNINLYITHYWLHRYLLCSSTTALVQISVQLSKSPCTHVGTVIYFDF